MCRFKYVHYKVQQCLWILLFATGTSSPLAYSMTLHNEGYTKRTHWAEFVSWSSASLPWRKWELLLNEMLPITTHHYRPVRSIPFSEPSAVVCFVSWVLHTAGAPGRLWEASFPLQARYNTFKAAVTQCSSQWQKRMTTFIVRSIIPLSSPLPPPSHYRESHNMINPWPESLIMWTHWD